MSLVKGKGGYTLGFLFSPSQTEVLLIEKRKPEWQAYKLNGIGGLIEEGEWPYACMVREFKEETGLHIPEWDKFAVLKGEWGAVHVFTATDECIYRYGSPTVEQVGIYGVQEIPKLPTVPSIQFLVPLALRRDVQWPVVFRYQG